MGIVVGDRAKIGAGSIVLRAIPAGVTAVGAPAKIIGKTLERDPASTMDEVLRGVSRFSRLSLSVSSSGNGSITTAATESTSGSDDSDIVQPNHENPNICPYRDYAQFA